MQCTCTVMGSTDSKQARDNPYKDVQLCTEYCKTGFDSDGLTAAKIAKKSYRYHWNLLQKLFPFYLIEELSSHVQDRYRWIAIIFIC